jgi:hypothetical protein
MVFSSILCSPSPRPPRLARMEGWLYPLPPGEGKGIVGLTSGERTIVILSPALGGTKDLEILRLRFQNDVFGQPLNPPSPLCTQPLSVCSSGF